MVRSRRSLRLHATSWDESRFGPARRLDIRPATDTIQATCRHAERWLRERQAARAGDVLVTVGKGHGGSGPASDAVQDAVQDAVEAMLRTLRRAGVVERVRVVQQSTFAVSLAPLRALFNAPARSRGRWTPVAGQVDVEPGVLSVEARTNLRRIAELSLVEVGVEATPNLIETEMRRILSRLSAAVPDDEPERGERFRFLLSAVRHEYEDP